VSTQWFIDLKINDKQIIKVPFYNGVGIDDAPSEELWRLKLGEYLPELYNYGYTYNLNFQTLTISNMSCLDGQETLSDVVLNVGINIKINCRD
jgi:hypothetical protein